MISEAELPESVALPGVPEPSFPLPPGALTADPSAESLPIAPLEPTEVAPLPGPGRLLHAARAVLGFLAHPYPRRRPKPALSREEHHAFAAHETARLERERASH